MTLIAYMLLTCGSPRLLNSSGEPWTQHDRDVIAIASRRCKELYERSPCLKVFYKIGVQEYSVICGR
jgi:hypothetical protein